VTRIERSDVIVTAAPSIARAVEGPGWLALPIAATIKVMVVDVVLASRRPPSDDPAGEQDSRSDHSPDETEQPADGGSAATPSDGR
jgi:hypothetical protein